MLSKWNTGMPDFDGSYLCTINQIQECGTTHEYYRVVDCICNTWVLFDKEVVVDWTKIEKTNLENDNLLSKDYSRELTLHNYWDSNTSDDRVEIVERAFKMIEKQKQYISTLQEELNGLVSIASAHGWTSNLVEQGKKLRDEMVLLHGNLKV